MLVGTAQFVIPALMNCSLDRTPMRLCLSDGGRTHSAILKDRECQHGDPNASY